jgi:hypothetical protein
MHIKPNKSHTYDLVGTSHSWGVDARTTRRPVPAHLCAGCRPTLTQTLTDRQSNGSTDRPRLEKPPPHGVDVLQTREHGAKAADVLHPGHAPRRASQLPDQRVHTLQPQRDLDAAADPAAAAIDVVAKIPGRWSTAGTHGGFATTSTPPTPRRAPPRPTRQPLGRRRPRRCARSGRAASAGTIDLALRNAGASSAQAVDGARPRHLCRETAATRWGRANPPPVAAGPMRLKRRATGHAWQGTPRWRAE